jgi:hypothetical protein
MIVAVCLPESSNCEGKQEGTTVSQFCIKRPLGSTSLYTDGSYVQDVAQAGGGVKIDVIATVIFVTVLDAVRVVDDTAIPVVPLYSLLSNMFCGGRSQSVCWRK